MFSSIFDFNKKLFKWFDWGLFSIIIGLSLLGILTIYGSTHNISSLKNYPVKQLIWLTVSIVAFFIVILINQRWIIWCAPLFYFALLILLTFLLVYGGPIKGSNSWLKLGPIRFQPSEFMKIIVVLLLSKYLSKRVGKINKIYNLIIPCLIVLFPMGLILKQPDLGTASVFIPILFALLYFAGVKKRLLTFLIISGIIISGSMYPFLKEYQKERIKVFLGIQKKETVQSSAYNIIQAEITLGSGRLFGKGPGKGTQTELQFLPEHHTDFIFSSLGEQFGFLGCLLLFFLYSYLILRVIKILNQCEDYFSAFLIIGLLTIFVIHIFLNIGMNVHLIPVIGLPLPFMSYGGSFLLSNFLIFGLIMNVKIRRFMF